MKTIPFTRFRVAYAYLRGSRRCFFNALRVLACGLKPPPTPQPDSEVQHPLPHHPRSLCACPCGHEGALKDHDAGCKWLAVMCRTCEGYGWCKACMGDGTEPPAAADSNLG